MTVPTGDMNEMEASPLRSYLTVLWRRKSVVIQPIVIVPLVALLLTHFQAAKYQSSAEVLLNRTDIAAALTGIQDPTAAQAAESRESSRIANALERVDRSFQTGRAGRAS